MKKALALLLMLACLWSIPAAQAAEPSSRGRASLYGKTLLVLGDSYTAGYGLWDGSHGWPDLVAQALGMTQLNYSISGSSFAAGPHGNYPMVERCRELPNTPVDVILLQGGSNDHMRDIPLGDIGERNDQTCCGALNLILDSLEDTYPDAQIVCFTPWISDVGGNAYGLTAQDYADAMVALCQQRGIQCYDASRAEESGMYLNDEGFRRRFCLTSTDRYHLNPAGHRRFAPIMAQWLSRVVTGGDAADRFADLQIAGEALRQGVAQVVATGVMTAEGQLFSPVRGTDRQLLAQSLYALAGWPPAAEYDIPDVPRNAENYQAICYVIDNGLLSGPEGFAPKEPLSREMLATALYRCYTELYGGQIMRLTGLGTFEDCAQVSEFAQTPMGWALEYELISPKNGLLRPQSTVSRGELATALSAFLRLLGEIS